MEDYYQKIEDSNIVNEPEWYKLLVKNTAGGLIGLITGTTMGLVAKFTGDYENMNIFVSSEIITGVYDVIRLVSPGRLRKREAIITGKSKLRLIFEDNLGMFAGNVLGYYLTSFIPIN